MQSYTCRIDHCWPLSRCLCWAWWRSQESHMSKQPQSTPGDGEGGIYLRALFCLLCPTGIGLLVGKLTFSDIWILGSCSGCRSWSVYFIQVQEWQGKPKVSSTVYTERASDLLAAPSRDNRFQKLGGLCQPVFSIVRAPAHVLKDRGFDSGQEHIPCLQTWSGTVWEATNRCVFLTMMFIPLPFTPFKIIGDEEGKYSQVRMKKNWEG